MIKTDKILRLVGLIFIVCFLMAAGWMPAAADTPPQPPVDPGQVPAEAPQWFRDSLRGEYTPVQESLSSSVVASSDHFGYSWNDTVSFDWQDISIGTPINIAGFDSKDDDFAGPINIGFIFPFYENKYTQLYISTNGFVSFEDPAYTPNNERIPLDPAPNNIIAPFWDDLFLPVPGPGNSYPAEGKVYYRISGASPNRKLDIQWHNVIRTSETNQSNLITFGLRLSENGNIRFLYQELKGDVTGATIGIEDRDGTDGLLYLLNAPGVASGDAVLFTRPADSARLKFVSPYQSAFAIGYHTSFQVPVRNTGDLGSDAFDLLVNKNNAKWQISLFNAAGTQPLVDSDHSGSIDTGLLDPGQTFTVTVKVEAPKDAWIGDYVSLQLTGVSGQDSNQTDTARLQSTLPASFAQVYSDDVQKGLRLSLLWPHNIFTSRVEDYYSGSNLAMVQTADGGYIYAWEKNGTKNVYPPQLYSDIEYTLLYPSGTFKQLPIKLTKNGEEDMGSKFFFDRFPSLASASNNRTAVTWVRDILDPQISKTNSNVYIAILGAGRTPVLLPTQLTSNTSWQGTDAPEIPLFRSPRVVATEDNRFILAWLAQYKAPTGYTADLWTAVIDSTGNVIRAPQRFASGIPGELVYLDPILAPLPLNRCLLSFAALDPNDNPELETYQVRYAVLNNQGGTVKTETAIPGGQGRGIDAQLLPSGDVLMAWNDLQNKHIAYALLDGSSYNLKVGPADLQNPDARDPGGVSITTDEDGHAILTWMDNSWSYYLYYTLIDEGGQVETPAMIFSQGRGDSPSIVTSSAGQGNAPYEGGWWSFLPILPRNPTQ